MAQNDNFVILEEGESQEEKIKKEPSLNEKSPKENSLKKTLLYIIIALLILTIIMLILLFILYLDKKEQKSEKLKTEKIIKDIKTKPKPTKAQTKTQAMLLKALKLQNSGKKDEALKIYEQISLTNKALAFYNIGVVKMRSKKYKEAIKYFQDSLNFDNYKLPSAINIAVCALELKDKNLFDKYLKLASDFLPLHINTPLYSYYISLINYYKTLYPETLVSIKNPTSNFYQQTQNIMGAKIATLLQNDHLAINFLQKSKSKANFLALGLLYARVGEYELAQKYLLKSINEGYFPLKSKAALALVYLKSGLFTQASLTMKELDKLKATNIYPIKVFLKESLFDPISAQEEFKKGLFLDDKRRFALIYYFSPFKFSNLKQTISYLEKGAKNLFIDETQTALEFLNRSKNVSEVDLSIAKAIKSTYEHRLYQAKKLLLKALNNYPSHSILHYNLALIYAKIDDFKNAYKHFLKSYRLDPNNYQAGIYSYMSSKILNIDQSKLIDNISENILKDHNLKQRDLLLALINIATKEDSKISLNNTQPTPLNLTIQILKNINKKNYIVYAKKLKNLLPKDLIAHIIYLDALYSDKDIKTYAKAIQNSFKNENLDYNGLFYGSALSKKLYIEILNIAGISYIAKNKLQQKLENENKDTIALLQALAYANIYTKNFEEAYVLYNELIDTHKQKDTNTIFFAAVAAIGANHHANAIALLELSKLIDPSNNESRNALGLLYHQAKNFEAAAIQYNKIGDINFHSNYFTFDIQQ